MPINADISSKFDETQRLFNKRMVGIEGQLFDEYNSAFNQIKKSLTQLYSEMEGVPSLFQASQQNRLRNLGKQVKDVMLQLDRDMKTSMASGIKGSFSEGYYSIGYQLETSLQMDLNFGLLSPNAVDSAVANPLNLVRWQTSADANVRLLMQGVRTEITSGLIQGNSLQKTTKTIGKRFSKSFSNKIMRIVRTENQRARSWGELTANDQARSIIEEAGMKMERHWLSTIDERTRFIPKDKADHRIMDNQIEDVNGYFTLSGGTLTQAPLLSGLPEQDIHCVVGNTQILSPHIKKVTKRYYEGELIEVRTTRNIITASPEHPILTKQGFSSFDTLNNRDKLVNCAFQKNVTTTNPNPNYRPVMAEKIFSLFKIVGTTERVDGIRPQFHSNWFDSNVDIVSSNSFLWNRIQSILFKNTNNKRLSLTHFAKRFFLSNSGFYHTFFRHFSSLSKFVASFDLMRSLGFGHSRPLDSFGFGLSSSIDSFLTKDSFDDSSADIELFCKGIFGNTIDISFDNIISIKRFDFRGHLYNLHTLNEFYLASNLHKDIYNYNILHNCRCTTIDVIEDITPKARRDNEQGKNIPFQSYEDYKKGRIKKRKSPVKRPKPLKVKPPPKVPAPVKTAGTKVPDFTPAKDIKGAEIYANRFLSSSTYRQWKKGTGFYEKAPAVNYRGIPLDQANRINEQLNFLFTTYPQLQPLTRWIKANNRSGEWASANGSQLNLSKKKFFKKGLPEEKFRSTGTDYVESQKTKVGMFKESKENFIKRKDDIVRDYGQGKYERDLKWYDRNIKDAKESMKFSRHNVLEKGREIESVITHELGHTIDDQISGAFNRSLRNKGLMPDYVADEIKSDWLQIFKRVDKSDDRFIISEYATTDKQELFAECFAMYHSPERSKLPKDILDYLEKYLKVLQ